MKLKFALAILLLLGSLYGQQPQTHDVTGHEPNFPVNASWVNGVAPGYAPTAGAGLTLNLGGGTTFCLGSVVTYSAATLTMANNATNYVYLDPASSCVPASNTSGFTASLIPIAVVVTSGGAITTITDDRTAFSRTSNSIFTYPGAGIACSTASAWCTSYGSGNLLPNNFLPNGWISATFATVSTTKAIAPSHYAGTVPANFSGATVTCDTNPAGSITFTVAVLHSGSYTTIGTVTLNTSCAATLATTGGTTQTFAADDRIAVTPGGADANAVNVVIGIPYVRN